VTRPVHLLLVHQAFALPTESGGTRHFELGSRWVRDGHRMTVIASDRNYLTGALLVPRAGLQTRFDVEGLEILRTYTAPTLHRSFLWRVVSFLSFSLTSLLAGLRTGRVDLVMGTTPPLPQAASAWMIAVLKRKPFVLEVRDLWPEFAIDMGILKNKLVIRLARWLEVFLYRRAKHIIVNSPAYGEYLTQKRGQPAAKISVIANGADPVMFSHASANGLREQFHTRDTFVAMYAGALGAANDIPVLLDAAEKLQYEDKIKFVLVGDGKDRPALERRAAGLRNVVFAGARPKAEMPAVLASADCCIATLQNIPMFTTTYPNKVFDYMAAGKPTILAIDGVIRKVVEDSEGGIFVRPGDSAALAEAVLSLYRDRGRARRMGASAQSFVAQHFNREQQANEFVRVLSSMVQN
jgi:glycosyltransferase involved in cell wall biosynthesis